MRDVQSTLYLEIGSDDVGLVCRVARSQIDHIVYLMVGVCLIVSIGFSLLFLPFLCSAIDILD